MVNVARSGIPINKLVLNRIQLTKKRNKVGVPPTLALSLGLVWCRSGTGQMPERCPGPGRAWADPGHGTRAWGVTLAFHTTQQHGSTPLAGCCIYPEEIFTYNWKQHAVVFDRITSPKMHDPLFINEVEHLRQRLMRACLCHGAHALIHTMRGVDWRLMELGVYLKDAYLTNLLCQKVATEAQA